RHDQARGELTAFEALPDEQKAAQYPAVLESLHKRGLLNDQEYGEWLQQNPAYPGSDAMKFGINHLATGAQLAKEEMERRNAASGETTAAARPNAAETRATEGAPQAGQPQVPNTNPDLRANAPKTAQEYQQRIDALPHGVATRILAAVPVDKFDPTTFT